MFFGKLVKKMPFTIVPAYPSIVFLKYVFNIVNFRCFLFRKSGEKRGFYPFTIVQAYPSVFGKI